MLSKALSGPCIVDESEVSSSEEAEEESTSSQSGLEYDGINAGDCMVDQPNSAESDDSVGGVA